MLRFLFHFISLLKRLPFHLGARLKNKTKSNAQSKKVRFIKVSELKLTRVTFIFFHFKCIVAKGDRVNPICPMLNLATLCTFFLEMVIDTVMKFLQQL